MGYETGKCDECGRSLQMIDCNANPRAAEGYCEKCHKSYVVPPEESLDEEDSVAPRRRRR